MTENPLISVVMPVYKVENYLSAAIDSVLEQTYENLELVLVDDCSPDKCGEICDEYVRKDNRIKVIHKEKNGGLGKARETGLEYVSGRWVMFMDSDDLILPDTLAETASVAGDNTDIVIFGFIMRYENAEGKTEYETKRIPENSKTAGLKEIAQLIVELDKNSVFNYMCNKLYRAEFLKNNGVEFNTVQSMEDFFYNIEAFPMAREIVTIDKPFYIYRKPKHETLVSAYNPVFFELCKKRYDMQKCLLQSAALATDENIQALYLIYIKHLISCLSRNSSVQSLSMKSKHDNIKKYLNDPLTEEILEFYMPTSLKMKLMANIFKKRNVLLAALVGRTVSFTQNKMGRLFSLIR